MFIYQDSLIDIELLKPDHIICVRWPEPKHFEKLEFELSFEILMKMLEKYQVKKMLWYANKTMIQLSDADYESVITLFQSGLAHSKVEKVARIYVNKSPGDLQRFSLFKTILNEMQLRIEIKAFDDRKTAIAWLKEDFQHYTLIISILFTLNDEYI